MRDPISLCLSSDASIFTQLRTGGQADVEENFRVFSSGMSGLNRDLITLCVVIHVGENVLASRAPPHPTCKQSNATEEAKGTSNAVASFAQSSTVVEYSEGRQNSGARHIPLPIRSWTIENA